MQSPGTAKSAINGTRQRNIRGYRENEQSTWCSKVLILNGEGCKNKLMFSEIAPSWAGESTFQFQRESETPVTVTGFCLHKRLKRITISPQAVFGVLVKTDASCNETSSFWFVPSSQSIMPVWGFYGDQMSDESERQCLANSFLESSATSINS
jgi:hypothetical protein